jgi:hypothetical protein
MPWEAEYDHSTKHAKSSDDKGIFQPTQTEILAKAKPNHTQTKKPHLIQSNQTKLNHVKRFVQEKAAQATDQNEEKRKEPKARGI